MVVSTTEIMDTISVEGDARRRPTTSGKRGRYVSRSVEEKRRIVEESLTSGASVARVARRHDLNANQLFGWRKQYSEGHFGPVAVSAAPALLAVRVEEPTERKTHPATTATATATATAAAETGWIEIECAARYRVRLHGAVDRVALATVLEVLAGR